MFFCSGSGLFVFMISFWILGPDHCFHNQAFGFWDPDQGLVLGLGLRLGLR